MNAIKESIYYFEGETVADASRDARHDWPKRKEILRNAAEELAAMQAERADMLALLREAREDIYKLANEDYYLPVDSDILDRCDAMIKKLT